MAEARLGVHPIRGLRRAGFEVDTSSKTFQCHAGHVGLVLYVPHPRFLWRDYIVSGFFRLIYKIRYAFAPAPLSVVAGLAIGVMVWVVNSPQDSWQRSGWLANLVWKIDSFLPSLIRPSIKVRVAYLSSAVTFGCMFLFSAFQRYLLRFLLAYTGWVQNRDSIFTKVWGFLVRHLYVRRFQKHLFAYQGSLPTLPLPTVRQTCEKYFETVAPLMDDTETAIHRQEMKQFIEKEASPLQNRLFGLWLWKRNYISDWWLRFVYLRSRSSLCINSNWYGIFFAHYLPTQNQAARAAVVTYNFTKIKREIDNETLEPQVLGGVAPLCMAQYQYCFSTTRVPGAEQDALERYDAAESRHVVVLHKGRLYKLPVFSERTNTQLTPLQLFAAFSGILERHTPTVDFDKASSVPPAEPVNDPDELAADLGSCDDLEMYDIPGDGVPLESDHSRLKELDPDTGRLRPASYYLPALTTMDRTEWHRVREKYFLSHSHNRHRLEAIEKALFVVCLDEDSPPDGDLSSEGAQLMCGNCCNRWCDKSFNVVIFKNGKAGVHAEHSWGDAPALAHILEIVGASDKSLEYYDANGLVRELPEDLQKTCNGKRPLPVYPAERIDFEVPPTLQHIAKKAASDLEKHRDNFDLTVVMFDDYGKDFISKSAKCSPDAWVQMGIQLAYFRDQNRLHQTYESSMTRLFCEGRTETIRTVSHESKTFVHSFDNPEISPKTKLDLIQKACARHQWYTHETMVGRGVDRHLFALSVVAMYLGELPAFLNRAMSRRWTLSTSQVPAKQVSPEFHDAHALAHTSRLKEIYGDDVELAQAANGKSGHRGSLTQMWDGGKIQTEFYTPCGGFGPVVDTGYGVCYNIWPNAFFFNVSGTHSAPNTDTKRFAQRIIQALRDMKKVILGAENQFNIP